MQLSFFSVEDIMLFWPVNIIRINNIQAGKFKNA